MISKEELEERYSKLSNKELLDILENKFSYTELAITVVIEEIAKRKLNEEDIKAYKTKKIEELHNYIVKNIVDDLNLFQKNIFYFVWIPFLHFPLKRNFADDGFILKLKQANYYSWLGFITCIIFTIIQSKLNFSTIVFLILWIASFLLAYLYDEFFNRQSQIRKLQRLFSSPIEEEKNDAESIDRDLGDENKNSL